MLPLHRRENRDSETKKKQGSQTSRRGQAKAGASSRLFLQDLDISTIRASGASPHCLQMGGQRKWSETMRPGGQCCLSEHEHWSGHLLQPFLMFKVTVPLSPPYQLPDKPAEWPSKTQMPGPPSVAWTPPRLPCPPPPCPPAEPHTHPVEELADSQPHHHHHHVAPALPSAWAALLSSIRELWHLRGCASPAPS